MKESMQQLIVQFIRNRKIRTRWNATKVSRKCITGTAQGVGRFFGWFNFFFHFGYPSDLSLNHNYNKIVKSDWLSTALISALIGQFNRTVRVMPK